MPDLEVRPTGKAPLRIGEDGSVRIKSNDIRSLLRSFGESDFINQIKQTSNAYTSSDYVSGISVDGNDGSQAQYLIGEAPVIFPYRFGGIFSTFNTPHFSHMLFSRGYSPHLPERLGPSFEFYPAYRFSPGIEGTMNLGMTSSSITVRGGIANSVAISISGRISYIDQIYDKILTGSRSHLNYSFHDLNVDAALRVSYSDYLKVGFFNTVDNVGYNDKNYSMDTEIIWSNTLYNLAYTHTGSLDIDANIYRSCFNNSLSLRMPQLNLRGPSSFDINGLNFKAWRGRNKGKIADWSCGLKFYYCRSTPQWAILNMSGGEGVYDRASEAMCQSMYSATIFGKLSLWITPDKLKIDCGSSFGMISSKTTLSGNYKHVITTPNMQMFLYLPHGTMSLSAGWYQQTVHQVGFSELGLASNFWITASKLSPLQQSFFLSGRYSHRLSWWGLKIEASAYWGNLKNQTEYRGMVMEVIDTDYNPFSHLIVSDGYNYGASIGITREFGMFTGDLTYSYGDGLRHLKTMPSKTWHSLNSEGNSMKFNVIWHEGNHWILSASWRIASGRRYTPVEALYTVGGNIAMEYGERNSARLPSYQRLDLGATYNFNTGNKFPLHHSINLSLINAYGHKNVEMQYFILDSKDGGYSLKRLYSLYRFLPSLSYSIEF